MNYKQFFIKTLVIFLISIILIPLGLIIFGNYFIGRYVYSKGSAHINYWIETKNNRAKELNKKGNKIVFLSGSNTLHSLDSKYTSEKTGLPILNYGVHADFGTYIFEKSKEILKDGDIVILPLEFNYYNEDSKTDLPSPFAEYIVSYDNAYFQKAPIMRKLGLVFFMTQYYVSHPNVIFEKNLLGEDDLNSLNNYGDFIGHKGTTERFSKYGKPHQISENIPKKYNNFALYHFIKYCREHDITLYATMPTIYHIEEYTPDEITAYNKIREFYKNQGVYFIGDMKSGSLNDKNLFNDTSYHTNEIGTKIRTDWFIDNILSMEDIKSINK